MNCIILLPTKQWEEVSEKSACSAQVLKQPASEVDRILERLERTRDWAACVPEPGVVAGSSVPGEPAASAAAKAPPEPNTDSEV